MFSISWKYTDSPFFSLFLSPFLSPLFWLQNNRGGEKILEKISKEVRISGSGHCWANNGRNNSWRLTSLTGNQATASTRINLESRTLPRKSVINSFTFRPNNRFPFGLLPLFISTRSGKNRSFRTRFLPSPLIHRFWSTWVSKQHQGRPLYSFFFF